MNTTIFNCLKKGTRFLESQGVPEAQISAEELLSYVLEKPRLSLYLDSETQIEAEHEQEFGALLQKRASRYPLQYLRREVPFRNVTLEIGEGCLIPRPETEILVEVLLKRLGRANDRLELLDIGTGSGNIAISIAQERPHWTIEATDISSEALYYAKRNAVRNNITKQIDFLEANNDYSVSFHNATKLLDDGRRTPFNNDLKITDFGTEQLIKYRWFVPSSSIVYRRIDTFPEWINYTKHGDLALLLIASKNGKLKYINEAMSVYRLHADGISLKLKGKKLIISQISLCETANMTLFNGHHSAAIEYRLDRMVSMFYLSDKSIISKHALTILSVKELFKLLIKKIFKIS